MNWQFNNFLSKKRIFAALFTESETHKEIFSTRASADIQLLLLWYQHVLTYPHHQRVFSSPLTSWRIWRAQSQRRSIRRHRPPV